MSTLENWLPQLVASPDGLELQLLELDLPVELRVRSSAVELHLPGQRLATGFDAPIGRVRVRLERSGDAS